MIATGVPKKLGGSLRSLLLVNDPSDDAATPYVDVEAEKEERSSDRGIAQIRNVPTENAKGLTGGMFARRMNGRRGLIATASGRLATLLGTRGVVVRPTGTSGAMRRHAASRVRYRRRLPAIELTGTAIVGPVRGAAPLTFAHWSSWKNVPLFTFAYPPMLNRLD